MTCAPIIICGVETNPRISARRGGVVDLNVDFRKNGVLTDPFAIRRVEIYKTSVVPHNLVTTIPIVDWDDPTYPTPACIQTNPAEIGECCTEPTDTLVPVAGRYHLPYAIPADSEVPNVYFDVWYYFAEDPCGAIGTENVTDCDIDDPIYNSLLLRCCHRFWIYPECWFCDDQLQTVRFGFEPLDQKFHSPEERPLEVGLMPLPLYDYNFNLVNPMIPYLCPTISIETKHRELLLDNCPCRIGIRQGSYRSNPWVIQYDLDTTKFLRGTYQYQIKLTLPNGSSRVSQRFVFTVS